MRNALVIVVIGTSLGFASPKTQALGFGRTANATQLGQALNFAAVIQLTGDETLDRECVFAEVYSGENKLAPGQVRVTLEPGNEPGERSVRVTSTSLIDEPVVTINVSVGCGAKLSRHFVAFIDPPLVNLAQADTVLPETLAPQRLDSAMTPLLSSVQSAYGSQSMPPTTKLSPVATLPPTDASPVVSDRPPRASRAAKPTRQTTRTAGSGVNTGAGTSSASSTNSIDSTKGANARRTASAEIAPRARKAPAAAPVIASAKPASKGKTPGVSRLQLEPSMGMLDATASATSASASSAAAMLAKAKSDDIAVPVAASAPDAAADVLAIERQRIQRLEEGAAQLSAESRSTRKALAQVQTRLQVAESERYANPLVYGLAALAALFAGFAVWALRRQPRAAEAPLWWGGEEESTSAALAPAISMLPDEPPEPVAKAAPIPPAVPAPSPVVPRWEASASMRLPVGSTRDFSPSELMTMPGSLGDESVDQLIDVEQQAEFFVVLGQDEAATDLLMAHVRSGGGASPLPYLRLLEIYHRCDDRTSYDRVRARFNRRYETNAPEWGADLQAGRTLEAYPELLGHLQSLWRAPNQVMAALEAALFRRTEMEATVDLPAYQELLFLFTIARDLSGLEANEPEVAKPARATDVEVDLLLPIAAAAHPRSAPPAKRGATPDTSAAPVPSVGRAAPVDFDLSMPMPLGEPEHAQRTGAASGEPVAPASNQIEFNDVPARPSEIAYQR